MLAQDITIIIITYNSENVIENCINAFPQEVRVLVLDNGSSDRTVALAKRHPSVEVIQNQNIGYGRAANIGFSKVATPYALLLNPDVKMDMASLQAMLDCIKLHPNIGILGARTFHHEQGAKIYQKSFAFNKDGLCHVEWIVGALMLFRMDAVRKVGQFDEHIFLFFEETEFCRRFVMEGFKLAICKQAEAEHVWGTSSTQTMRTTKIRAWHSAWSRAYYYRKHFGRSRFVKKSLSKFFKNIFNIIKYFLLMRRQKVIINAYEIMGLMAFVIGMEAFDANGKARIT